MEALKIKLYQETAVYRNPVTMEIIESFPLPPPSTILGLFCNIWDSNGGIPELEILQELKLSIQGTHQDLLRDYQWYKKGDEKKWNSNPYPMIVNVLSGVELVLHVSGEKELLKRLADGFRNPPYFLYIGRAEDLVKIEEVKFVDYKLTSFEEEAKYSAYLEKEFADELELNGPLFSLSTTYELLEMQKSKKEKVFVREFEWKDFIFVEEFDEEDYLVDSDGDLVLWQEM